MRFSLRGMLLLMTAICLFLGWRTYYQSKLRAIERRLSELEVHCGTTREKAAQWQLQLFGDAIYTNFDRVNVEGRHLQGRKLEEIVDLLLSWGGVREVVFANISTPIERGSYEQIARLESLERIVFDYCEPGNASAMEPLTRLPKLKEISIEITWAKSHPFPFDFYLSLPGLKVLGLPSWSDKEARYVEERRPDIQLQVTDFPP